MEEKNTSEAGRCNCRIITIDGPAGSGKSTIAKLLSRNLGLKYIDTGAMYRTLTLLALENNIDPEDEASILDLAEKSRIEFENAPVDESRYTVVKLNGKDVTDLIRSEKVGASVSIVSRLSGVRKYLVSLQRKMASGGNAVLEGRDTGSVVYPNALLKIFMTASIEERVSRRQKQILGNGLSAEKEKIIKEIKTRDTIDSSRKDSPLVIPEGAVIIDSSKLSINETYEKIRDLFNERIQTCN